MTCPHCGAENSSGIVFCAECQKNVHHREAAAAKPAQRLSPEESELADKIERANRVLCVCVSIVSLAALIVVGKILALPDTPDSGFAVMAMMFAWMIWGPLLLFPLIGIVMALKSKWTAEAQLRELRGKDGGASSP